MEVEMCQQHWDKLKAQVHEKGLSSLMADGPEEANARLERIKRDDGYTIDNFEPLVYAMQAIVTNAMAQDAAIVMTLSWYLSVDSCPICGLNAIHDEHCDDDDCDMGENPFECWIDRAADDALETWQGLGT